jgi:hypothetical protein
MITLEEPKLESAHHARSAIGFGASTSPIVLGLVVCSPATSRVSKRGSSLQTPFLGVIDLAVFNPFWLGHDAELTVLIMSKRPL